MPTQGYSLSHAGAAFLMLAELFSIRRFGIPGGSLMLKTKRKAYIAIVHLLKIHKNRFSGNLITLSTQKRCTSMAQTVAPSGHQCFGPVTPFIAQITSKFDMIIQVSLRSRASNLQVKFSKNFTLSGIGKTLLIMVGK